MEFVELNLTDHEFRKIRGIVYKATGINLAHSKRALIVSRLYKRLRQLELGSFAPYIARLQSDPDEIFFLINRITTNITKFYREKNQFDILRGSILPLVMENKKKKKEKILRIWSAGCSTGEEVYTILFELLAAFNGHIPLSLDVKILGSDIDTNVLKKARSGAYDSEELKGIEGERLRKYFDEISPGHYRVKEGLRKHVGFRRINLVHDAFHFKHRIDIIFCRNVVIYFDKETRRNVYKKFHQVLNNPGFFFSGHSENLFSHNDVFAFIDKSVYKKVV